MDYNSLDINSTWGAEAPKIEANFAKTSTELIRLSAATSTLAVIPVFKDPVPTFSALATTYPAPLQGWSAMVEDVGVIYQYNGMAWASTGLSNFPTNVATLSDLELLAETTNMLKIQSGLNLINPFTVVDGYYINIANGVLVASNTYGTSDYIKVEAGKVYTGVNNKSATSTFRNVGFYDVGKNFISGIDAITKTFTTPNNAAFVRVTMFSSVSNAAFSYDQYALFLGSTAIWVAFSTALALNYSKATENKTDTELAIVKDIKNSVLGITDQFMNAKNVTEGITLVDVMGSNIANPENVLFGKLVDDTNGTIISTGVASNYDTFDFIPVIGNISYKGLSSTNALQYFRKGAYYDANKVYISGFDSLATFTTPTLAKYVRLSVMNTAVGYNIANVGLFLSSITVFEPYLGGTDYKINPLKTHLKSNTSIATINDVKELSKQTVNGALRFIKSGNSVTFIFDKGNIGFNLMSGGNGIANFISTAFKDVVNTNSDDVAPVHIMNTTLGANHAQPYNRATINAAHGLTNSSVGTAWTHSNGNIYYIIEIVSATVLGFLSTPTGTREDFVFTPIPTGTITRNGITLTISGVTGYQFYGAGLMDHSVKVMSNGLEEITTDGEMSANYVDVVERYTVKNYVDILNNLIASAGAATPQYIGSPMITFENTYRFLPNGSTIVISNVVANQNMKFQDCMFSQADKIMSAGTVKYYVPNSLPISTYDFRKPLSVDWSGSIPAIYFTNAYWADANNPVNRVVQYYNNTGFVLGFLKDYGVGRALKDYTSASFEIRNNTGKVYPHGVDSGKMGTVMLKDKIYSAVMYRSFTDLSATKVGNRMSMFNFPFNDAEYVILDYSGSMLDHVIINDSLNAKRIEVMESVNTALITDTYNNGFYVQANYSDNQTCFIVLKIK